MKIQPIQTFIHYLRQLEHMLDVIEGHGHVVPDILQQRLADDMFPLIQQVRTAVDFTLRAVCPVLRVDICSFAGNESGFDDLHRQIAQTIDYLDSLPATCLEGKHAVSITTTAGLATHHLLAEDYLANYAMPNFFFHLSMVYAIARQSGIPLGKPDFDGFHQYPANFRF